MKRMSGSAPWWRLSNSPVKQKQTPYLKKEGGEISQIASHRVSPASLPPLRRAHKETAGILREQAQIFCTGVGVRGREGAVEDGGLDCPHQTPLLFLTPPLLSSSSSHPPGSRGTLFVSRAVERLPLTPPLPISAVFLFFLSFQIVLSICTSLLLCVFCLLTNSCFFLCLRVCPTVHLFVLSMRLSSPDLEQNVPETDLCQFKTIIRFKTEGEKEWKKKLSITEGKHNLN